MTQTTVGPKEVSLTWVGFCPICIAEFPEATISVHLLIFFSSFDSWGKLFPFHKEVSQVSECVLLSAFKKSYEGWYVLLSFLFPVLATALLNAVRQR